MLALVKIQLKSLLASILIFYPSLALSEATRPIKDDAYWQSKLSPEQFRVCRKQGTERPFSGKYNDFKRKGVFKCSSCGNALFRSEVKFDSGSGWPSFHTVIPGAVNLSSDRSAGMNRTEVSCSRCGAHLGHLFEDGPAPTGQRYCINSVCLEHEEE